MRAPRFGVAAASSVAVLALVGLLGDSAATPGLGPRTATPPWDLAAGAPGWLVTVLLVAAYATGAVAVLAGLRRPPVPSRRAWALAGAGLVLLALVPPVGSADHLSYAAYGRIAAAGDDPYSVAPIAWRGGTDPVAGAVAPPWQRTPSVYGPVATALQALVAAGGHGSLRLTVWLWQLLVVAAFALVTVLLLALAGPDPAARGRVLVAWAANPLLLGQLVLGAHVDVIAAALALAGVAVAVRTRGPLPAALAGALLAAAVATKLPYGLFAPAAVWAVRRRPGLPPALAAGAVGGLAVLVPGYLWAGPHALDQLRTASRYTSLATPWRAVVNVADAVLGRGVAAAVVGPLALLLAAGLAWLLARRLGAPPPGEASAAARAALVLAAAWVLTAPYALPWYDAMVWAPLALTGATVLDRLLAARLLVLALAYVPGRVVGLSPAVEAVTLGLRTFVAPVLVLAVLVAVVRATRGADKPA